MAMFSFEPSLELFGSKASLHDIAISKFPNFKIPKWLLTSVHSNKRSVVIRKH